MIKDDLGMPVAETKDDEWLKRRIDAVLDSFRRYTQSVLYPSQGFKDDFTPAQLRIPFASPPHMPSRTMYLRQCPIITVSKITFPDGSDGDLSKLQYEGITGKLISYDQGDLPSMCPIIEYTAGYETIPADLYDALIGVLSPQWSSRKGAASGLDFGGFAPASVDIADVGNIRLQKTALGYSGGMESLDPLLGPYTVILDPYCDLRSAMGLGEGSTSVKMTSNSPYAVKVMS
jgi:hypothetical protein